MSTIKSKNSKRLNDDNDWVLSVKVFNGRVVTNSHSQVSGMALGHVPLFFLPNNCLSSSSRTVAECANIARRHKRDRKNPRK